MQFEINDKVYIIEPSEMLGRALDFAADHQEGILVSIPLLYALGKGIKDFKSERRKDKATRRRSYTQWDPKNMHFWELRRPLTNREHRLLDMRVKRGERMVDVLQEMRVLL